MVMMTNRRDRGELAQALSGLANVVLLDEDMPGTALPRIFVESRAGARMATAHLVGLGHRRIALVTGQEGVMSVGERRAGRLAFDHLHRLLSGETPLPLIRLPVPLRVRQSTAIPGDPRP